MKQIFRISFIFLGILCLRSSAFARMPKPFLYMRTTINLGDKVSPNADVDDSLFDAEEAAAVDSHDLSDPGLEGAAMERAVMLAEEYKEQQLKKKKEMERRRSSAALIKSLDEQHDKGRKATFLSDDEFLLEAEDAAAVDSHDLSDPGLEGAAMERAVMLAEEYKEQQLKKKKDIKRSSSEPCVGGAALIRSLDEQNDKVRATNLSTDDESLLDAEEAAAIDAHDVNDSGLEAAAMERAVMLAEEYKAQQMRKNEKKRTERMKSIEDHYKQVKKDIEAIERLIKEADDADHASGHSLERTFSEDDAADLALMMMEKSVVAASDKLEMCLEKVKQTEQEVRTALEKKYSSKALAESIERERHAEEMRFLSNKYRGDNVIFSAVHDNDKVLHDAHRQEHDAELQLEKAIEEDIATKKDLEEMIENKAALKEVLHEIQEIIHEHAALAMEGEKERTRKSKR